MDGLTVTLEVEAGVGGKLTVMLDDDGVDGDKLTVILDVDWVIDGVDGVDSGRLLLALGATEVDAKLLVGADPALSEARMLLLVTAATKDVVFTLLGRGTTELVLSICTGVGLGLSSAAEDEDDPVSAVLVIEDDDWSADDSASVLTGVLSVIGVGESAGVLSGLIELVFDIV